MIWTVEDGTKLVPVMVTVTGLVPPATILEGDTVMELPGVGLLTEMLEAADVPPPGVALTAVRERDPEETTSASDKVTLILRAAYERGCVRIAVDLDNSSGHKSRADDGDDG